MMEYQGYIGRVEFDDDAAIFHGEVINTRDVITFQGESVAELQAAFSESVDDYLAFCKERGEEPDKPFSGRFVTRITPELHRQVSMNASKAGQSLNSWVEEQLRLAVAKGQPSTKQRGAKKAKHSGRTGSQTSRRRHSKSA